MLNCLFCPLFSRYYVCISGHSTVQQHAYSTALYNISLLPVLAGHPNRHIPFTFTQSLTHYTQETFSDFKNMYGNFMAVVFSVKPHLIRNCLSVNNIISKLITGLQITFRADNSFNKKNLLICFVIPGDGAILENNHHYFYAYVILSKNNTCASGHRISGKVRGSLERGPEVLLVC